MIDLDPVISLPTFVIGFLALLFVARLVAELIELKKKSSSNRGNDRTSGRGLTPSQKSIQRYYSRNQYENKGA